MRKSDQNWQQATTEVSILLQEGNSRFCAALKDVEIQNQKIDYSETVRKFDEKAKSSPQEKPYYDLASYKATVDYNHFIDDRTKLLGEMKEQFKAFKAENFDQVRNFGDIVRGGPLNDKENNLLNAAKTFMSPSDIEEAVQKNAPASEVVASIESSAALRLSMLVVQIDKAEEEREASTRKEMARSEELEKMHLLQQEVIGIIPMLQKELEKMPVFNPEPEVTAEKNIQVQKAGADKLGDLTPENTPKGDVGKSKDHGISH